MLDLLKRIQHDFATLDTRAITALTYAAVGLTAIYYLKDPNVGAAVFTSVGIPEFASLILHPTRSNLPALSWWVAVVTVFYIVIPLILIKFVWRSNIADYGINLRIDPGFHKLLAICLTVMIPLVYVMSLTTGFAGKYPFFRIFNGESYLGPMLITWQLLYFLQFFGLEFFFRGFLVHSLKPALGLYSVFVMTVPYCMIHFGKPPAETIAAILAGIFLGWLSFKNGSIWLGLILHCAVALLMDLFALHAKGLI